MAGQRAVAAEEEGHDLSPLRLILLIAATFALLACAPAERPPNIVLINVDDLGWRDVGCYGSPHHETPHIDSLCAEGAVFTNAYAGAAVCSPTRAAILTGRNPVRSGVTDWIYPSRPANRRAVTGPDGEIAYWDERGRELLVPSSAQALDPSEVTIAEVLSDAGYATAHIGKWHLGGESALPTDQGFEVNLGGSIHGHPPSYFDPYVRKGRKGLPGLPPREPGEYLTDRETDEAIRFMRENRDDPFFLNLWHHAVHPPIQAPDDLVAKYEQLYQERAVGRRRHPTYAAMVEGVDRALGKLVSALDELGISENTLLLFTSDNGGFRKVTTNAPLRGGKGEPYEGGIRVPQILRWKGRIAATSSDIPVSSVDLLPTIAEAAGVPLPAGTLIDGSSLLPMLGGHAPPARSLYWHYPHYWMDEAPYSVIRRGPFKLIRRYEGERYELYDLENDIGERRNLAAEMPDQVRALDEDLTTWLEETGALLPRLRAR